LANAALGPLLAIDLPSGLDATDGSAFAPAVRATATLTLALPKTGLLMPRAAPHLGELYLADIGIPHEAYRLAGIDEDRIAASAPLFDRADMIRITPEAGGPAGMPAGDRPPMGRSGEERA
jgi:NAD(P)H-hydrate epimerase